MFLVPVLSKQPAAAKVLLDKADRAFEHLCDFAGLPEAADDEIVILLVPGAVDKDGVDVRVEAQVGGTP